MVPIKVLSASEDTAFRTALRSAIADDEGIELTETTWDDSDRLLAVIRATSPDLVLLDEAGAPPHALMRQIHAILVHARLIVVMDECGQRELADLIRQGARGCIQKGAPRSLWRKAIHAVHEGDIWVNRNVMLELLEALVGIEPDSDGAGDPLPDGRLTEREWEVARLVAMGMTNKEVARSMTISDTTVKTHLKHIFGKLHVTRRGQIPHQPGPAWSLRRDRD